MTGFYDITTTIKNQLIQDAFVNTVTEGDIFEVDLKKQTIFPLSHIMVNQTTREGHALRFNITVMCMDIVDKSKEAITDVFTGNDNEQDVLNTQLAVALRLVEVLDRGSNRKTYQLDGNAVFEPFTERFENYLAGWSVTFDVMIANTMTVCDAGAALVTCPNATYIVEYADGTPIESGTISSGGSKTIVVPDCPTCDVATWTLLDTLGNVLDSGTIPSGGSANITAPNSTYTITDDAGNTLYSGSITSGGSLTQEIADSTAVLKDTAGSTISSTSINAEGSADITAPDGTVTITDDSANVLHTVSVKSNGSASQVISDSTVTITDDSANTLYTLSVNAEGSASQVITDSTVTIKDDSNNTLHTVSVNAQGSAEQIISDSTVQNSDASYSVGVNAEGSLTVPNSQINVNGVDQGDVVSVKTIDVNITDGVDPVTPDSVSLNGNILTIAVPSDSTYTITDDDGNTLYSGSIPSGGSLVQEITDSTAVLKDTAGSTISTTSINAQGSADITAPDATVNVNGTLWNTVVSGGTENVIVRQSTGSVEVGYIEGQYFRIADSNVTNSDGSYDVDVKAEDSLILPNTDYEIYVNGVLNQTASLPTLGTNIINITA